jgi:hypothetical protein
MEWERTRDEEDLVEWTREDGYVTLRRRHHPDGSWVVRLDRLHQSPEGSAYRRERVDDAEAATSLLERWKRDAASDTE